MLNEKGNRELAYIVKIDDIEYDEIQKIQKCQQEIFLLWNIKK